MRSTPDPRSCAECGSGLPEGARFCPQCGTKAAPSAPAETAPPPVPAELRERYERARAELRGERRQVTVLFADVQGYTELAESRDPEEISFFMHRLLRQLAEVVYRYEGHVDKFIGDAVMALFGAPIAHENDPERAVLAALEMLEIARRRKEESGVEIALRAGLNLGEVVAGRLGADEAARYTVMGDAVNVASRLEGAAEPNSVLVSEPVHRRIAARFDTEEVPALSLKGKSEPVRAFRVEAYRPAGAHRGGERSPFVGREEELAAVATFLERVARGMTGSLLVEAEAGAGKSRLLAEARARQEGGVRTLELAFQPIHSPDEVAAPSELFRRLHGESAATAAETALGALGDAADEHRAGVAGLAREAGLEPGAEVPEETDPATARQNRWLAIRELLAAAARRRPILLVVEDLHWAEEPEREFLKFLLGRLPPGVGAVLTSRPPAPEVVPESAGGIRLAPLREAEVREMAGPLWNELRREERRALVRRSQGNPLYLEELARAAREGADPARVPGSIQGLIRSRVDRLPPPVQTLLQMAAVLGPRFPEPLLERMYRLEPQPLGFEEGISELEGAGFFDPVDGAEGEERRFRHALAQEVAYRGLLHRVRRVLHETAARIGEEIYADRLEPQAPFFAHHYWEADLAAEAAPHLWRAGKSAAESFELATAEEYLDRAVRAIEIHPDVLVDPETRADLWETTGFVLLNRGDLEKAETTFSELESLADAEGVPGWGVRATEYRGRIAWYRGGLDEAARLFDEGLQRLPSEEDRLAADLHNDLGIVWLYRGDPGEAERHHRRALEIRERTGDRQGMGKSHLNLGNIRVDLGEDLDGAERHYERARALAEEVGDRQLRASALGNLGRIAMERGAWEEAIEQLREARERAGEIGWTFGRFLFRLNRAFCEVQLGRIADAVPRLETCIADGGSVLEPVNRVNARLYLFDAWLRARDQERSGAAAREARAVVEELEVTEMEDEVRLIEARLLAAAGEWAAAEEAFAGAAETARRFHHPSVEKLARAHRCRAAARAGSPAPEPCPEETSGRRPLAAVIGYLAADTEASREPAPAAARALEEAGERAAGLGDPGLERAAWERAGETWEALGEADPAASAYARAADALRRLGTGLPPEHRDAFLSHPANAELLGEGEPAG